MANEEIQSMGVLETAQERAQSELQRQEEIARDLVRGIQGWLPEESREVHDRPDNALHPGIAYARKRVQRGKDTGFRPEISVELYSTDMKSLPRFGFTPEAGETCLRVVTDHTGRPLEGRTECLRFTSALDKSGVAVVVPEVIELGEFLQALQARIDSLADSNSSMEIAASTFVSLSGASNPA